MPNNVSLIAYEKSGVLNVSTFIFNFNVMLHDKLFVHLSAELTNGNVLFFTFDLPWLIPCYLVLHDKIRNRKFALANKFVLNSR